MARSDQDRLAGRDGVIWKAYVSGATQEAIANEHGISRERVRQIRQKHCILKAKAIRALKSATENKERQ